MKLIKILSVIVFFFLKKKNNGQGPNRSYWNLVSCINWKTEIILQKWLRFLKIMIKFAKRMQAEKL